MRGTYIGIKFFCLLYYYLNLYFACFNVFVGRIKPFIIIIIIFYYFLYGEAYISIYLLPQPVQSKKDERSVDLKPSSIGCTSVL